jgi:CNT family concentrative nucleoside transporter
MTHLAALLGIFAFIGLAWLLSERRDRFPLRTVLAGLALQVLLGTLILRTQAGAWFFERIDLVFQKLLSYAAEGTAMVFGPLANSKLMAEKWGAENGFLFAVTITGTIVLVSALSSLLYHYGLLQRVVRGMAWVMRHLMGVSGSESLAAAANIFMGQTEAPLVIKPYLATMTRSELLALMTGGMATIAGGVLAAYIAMGISPGHLLTASVMSAPASLMIAKIMLPETHRPTPDAATALEMPRETVNGLDALCQGASEGMKLALNVLAMLIAFVAIVAMANGAISALLDFIGIVEPRPLQWLLGWLNAPFAWLMGVPWQDCASIGGILGERIVLNEFIGYLSLCQAAEHLQPESITIATYALCGFANFASIAIQIGGIGALAQGRRNELAQLGLRAMIGGLLACYSTACIAGLLTHK